MTTKQIVKALVNVSAFSPENGQRGEIIEWGESDTHASLAVEFGKEVFEIEITVRKRRD